MLAHGWLAVQQDPQGLLCSWHMQLLFQKTHIFPLLHEDPLFTFFCTAAQTSSVCISQFSLSYIISKLAEGKLCHTAQDFNEDVLQQGLQS